jgi:hypothetical protein
MSEQPTPTADEYRRLTNAAHSLLDTADTAARSGDTATEQRATRAAGRLLDAANGTGASQ